MLDPRQSERSLRCLSGRTTATLPDSVIGNTTDSDSVILGSSPSRAAPHRERFVTADYHPIADKVNVFPLLDTAFVSAHAVVPGKRRYPTQLQRPTYFLLWHTQFRHIDASIPSELNNPDSLTVNSMVCCLNKAVLTQLEWDKRGISPHSLSYFFANHMFEAGVSLKLIQKYLGHKHQASTMT